MKLTLICAVSALACIAAAPAAAQMTDEQAMRKQASRMDTVTTDGFVTNAAIGDMYEIQAGELAQQMGKSDGVRQFGAMMVRDHTQTSSRLKSMLPQAGVTKAPPMEMDARRQRMIADLRSSGDRFDATYLAQQKAAHQEMLLLMNGYAQNGDNPALKSLAAETAPVVQGHLQHVEQMAAAMPR